MKRLEARLVDEIKEHFGLEPYVLPEAEARFLHEDVYDEIMNKVV